MKKHKVSLLEYMMADDRKDVELSVWPSILIGLLLGVIGGFIKSVKDHQ